MRTIKIAIAAAFTIFALAAPAIPVSAASCGETVRQNTESALKAIDYETNETIAAKLAPSRYTMADKLNKKMEISKRDNIPIGEITDAMAIKELNLDNLKVSSFDGAFAEVQANIGDTIQRIADNTESSKTAEQYTNTILNNKENLLLGLTYLERLYDFEMGGHNIKDSLLYEWKKPFLYGKVNDVLDWLIYIGNAGGDKLKISKNTEAFGTTNTTLFYPVTFSTSLDAFLEECRVKWMPDTSLNDWFLQKSRAYIVEKTSAWDGNSKGIYQRLWNDSLYKSYILPLLTVSEDSVYVIANSATITYGIVDCYIDRALKNTNPTEYAKKREAFKEQLQQAANQQTAFIDFWYRIAKPEKKGQLSSSRIVLDSLRIDPDTPGTAVQWSEKLGENASQGVKEFFAPLDLWGSYIFVDGVAEGNGIRYYLSKALTERGLATYAHELTHILVSGVMLNGYGSRDGMLAEVYTRGTFEPYEPNDPPAFNLNLIYDRQSKSDRYHNGRPDRFQDENDLKNYMSGILDVIYTLDYAEADVILGKTTAEKMKWFHKLEQIEDPKTRVNQGESGSKHNLDSVRTLNQAEAAELNTLDDLIRGSIIASRYEVDGTTTTGTLAANGYYVVPLFSANYAAVQNDSGVSGDIMIRRQAFELLAEYGYYNGMVPYISNQYKEAAKSEGTILSDTYILQKIFGGGAYGTMADFKKAMFQKRIDKTGNLKPITITWNSQSVKVNTFEDLRLLMKEAVEFDLVNVNVTSSGSNNIRAMNTKVERLKQEIFKAYLSLTGDFKESIYGAGQPENPDPEQPENPDPEQPETPDPEQPENPDPEQPEAPDPEQPGVTNPEPPKEPENTGNTGNTSTQPSQIPNTGTTGDNSSGTGYENIEPSLLLCRVSAAKTSQTIRWNPVKSADGYEIYGAKNNGKYKRLGTAGKDAGKWKHKKLKKGTQYRYYVTAYKNINGRQVTVSKSLPVYSITKGGKYGNPSKISAKRSSVSVKTKKKVSLRVKVSGKKLKKSSKKVRYVSSDPSVAKVSSKGVITGKKRGTCTVYSISQNGLTKKIKVKVK